HDALYGAGNDPNATNVQMSRPYARDEPFTWGGDVTLQHFQGSGLNTTDFLHPLEGTVSRNLVADLNNPGSYQVMTLGRGEGGAPLATGLGALAGLAVDGVPGAVVGGLGAQNASHELNPYLGYTVFSMLDNSMIASISGTHNPNLDLPSGLKTEGLDM